MQKSLILAFLTAIALSVSQSHPWQLLNKHNFSSQIRLHPNIILIVTLPWCGESRSLMKQLSRHVSDQSTHDLKLMVVYRNAERMLAEAIGATEEISVFFYHHSLSYKYRGTLRAPAILSSAYHILSTPPEDLPLKIINSPKDLKFFLDSTDKAVLLADFCGWAPKLLPKLNKNGTHNDLIQDVFDMGFTKYNDRMLLSGRDERQKGSKNAELKCSAHTGFSGIPWFQEFSSVDVSASSEGMEYMSGSVCTFEDFQQFEKFFSKFVTVTREFFLPLERHRFGLVSSRPLLSSLGVRDPSSWLSVLYVNGCPGCLRTLKNVDDLMNDLQEGNSFVRELEADSQGVELNLPADQPSVILFVDRSSNSWETRIKSKEALDALRELAGQHKLSDQMSLLRNSSLHAYKVSKGTSRHHLQLSYADLKNKLREKMSIMIVNENKHVSLDNLASNSQDNSMHEILTYLLDQKKKTKLSSLAKKLGFQLLSDDVAIKGEESLTSEAPVEPFESLLTSTAGDDVDFHSNQLSLTEQASAVGDDRNSKLLDTECSSGDVAIKAEEMLTSGMPTESDKIFLPSTEGSPLAFSGATSDGAMVPKPGQISENSEPETVEDVKVENAFLEGNMDQLQLPHKAFLFSDGNYRLLRTLTGAAIVPSLVLVDPNLQQHYVFPAERKISRLSLSNFLDEFMKGSLIPYQQSETTYHIPHKDTRPPFVNLDFHEANSIPRVTPHTFSELVFGVNETNQENAQLHRMEDVVVLFTNSWCGFCERMELVASEFYRALKGYMEILKGSSGEEQAEFSDVPVKVPQMYLMDCTLNECSVILKSMNQREVYPVLLLFPAGSKKAIPYVGNLAVADVVKFVAEHGSNSHHLVTEKGILWMKAENGGRSENLTMHSSEIARQVEASGTGERWNLGFKFDTLKTVLKQNSDRMTLAVGSIIIATDKLLNSPSFDKSRLLIVKADQIAGFQGLIVNKHIGWDTIQLREGLEFLKEARLSYGGPVIQRGMPLIALTRRVGENRFPEVFPGVHFLDQLATEELEELKSKKGLISDYWFFLGYAGWSWEQLYGEIEDGAWTISDSNSLVWPYN